MPAGPTRGPQSAAVASPALSGATDTPAGHLPDSAPQGAARPSHAAAGRGFLEESGSLGDNSIYKVTCSRNIANETAGLANRWVVDRTAPTLSSRYHRTPSSTATRLPHLRTGRRSARRSA